MRAVLDANVIISGLIRPQGPPGQIMVRLLRDRAFELVASPSTLDELRRSLRYARVRKHLPFGQEQVDLHVEALAAVSVIVEGKVTRPIIAADPDDDVSIAAAVEGLAEYVVSGDRHLLDLAEYWGIRMVAPRAFLDLLQS